MSPIFHMRTPNTTSVLGGPEPDGYNAWFVDSVNGDDDNDGLTAATPFATLARVEDELDEFSYVNLATGSVFREELTDWPAGVHVRSYGYGDRPIIDGRENAVNASFVKTDGRTNVYEIAWTHGFDEDGGKTAHRVWESGTMMSRAASLAACDSTPGSFYAGTPTAGGPDTIYVHPTGSASAITNGREYAIAKRRWCVQLYESYKQAHVVGLETIGNAHADGSLVIDGYAEDCVARDGRIHNAFILGHAKNCQALATEPGVNSTFFVSYIDVGFGGPTVRNILYENCIADAQATTESTTGFYVHTDNVRLFGTVEWRDCQAIGVDSAWGGIQAQKFVTYRCGYDDVRSAYSLIAVENFFLGGSGKIRAGFFNGGLLALSIGVEVTYIMHGCKTYGEGSFNHIIVNAPAASITVERCTITSDVGGTVQFSRGNVTYRRCVVAYGNNVCAAIGTADNQIEAFDSDYNCFWTPGYTNAATQSLYPTQSNYTTIADWRTYLNGAALGTGKDANSLAVDPQIAGRADLDFTIGNATVLALGAGAEVDEEDDDELQAYWVANRVTEV